MLPLLFLAIFGGFYGLMYYLNSKAPMPEGAKAKMENCHGCSISSCELHPNNQITEVS